MKISNKRVPNEGDPASNIYVIGESPGEQEEEQGRPFVGPAGIVLRNTLNFAKISESEVYFANLSQYRPSGNKFALLRDSDELSKGIDELYDNLHKYKPNVTVLLGNEPLYHWVNKRNITYWRGSILKNIGRKFVASFHPSYIYRNPQFAPYFSIDMQRVRRESLFPEVKYPDYKIDIEGRKSAEFLLSQPRLTCDIENIKHSRTLLCIGFGWSDTEACVFDLNDFNQKLVVQEVLEKHPYLIFHYGFHDNTFMRDAGYKIGNWKGDTFLQAQVIAPELSRDLGTLGSFYTNQPAYKKEGRGTLPNDEKSWKPGTLIEGTKIYNGQDDGVTFKVFEEQGKIIEDDSLFPHTYEARIALAPRLIQLNLNGLPIDIERKAELSIEYKEEIDIMYLSFWHLVKETLGKKELEIYNIRSPKDMPRLLYEELGLPVKTKMNKKTREKKVTTDDDALVSLIGFAQNKVDTLATPKKKQEWENKLYILKVIQKLRKTLKEKSSYIDIEISADNRARSMYKQSAETSRLACEMYFDGTGFNAQTMPRKGKFKQMVRAGKGNILLFLDYGQIETWMSAHTAREQTMISMLKNSDIHTETATALFGKKFEDIVFEERYCGKRSNHSLTYGMTPFQFVRIINKEGIITVALATTKEWYRIWHSLYPGIQTYWADVREQLKLDRTLINPYGTKRTFYERENDELYKSGYAHLPQSTAADHCFGTIHPELGVGGGLIDLIDEFPDFIINTSHDSAGLEIPFNLLDEVKEKAYDIMLRPCVINGMEFTVPVDIEVGERLSEMEKVKIAA